MTVILFDRKRCAAHDDSEAATANRFRRKSAPSPTKQALDVTAATKTAATGPPDVSVALLGVQQREGVADALFEEFVGELPVGQGTGEL